MINWFIRKLIDERKDSQAIMEASSQVYGYWPDVREQEREENIKEVLSLIKLRDYNAKTY